MKLLNIFKKPKQSISGTFFSLSKTSNREIETTFEEGVKIYNTINAENINSLIKDNQENLEVENISDGYHTFKELYEFRKIYNAVLFNMAFRSARWDVHKSRKHFDGTLCFGGKYFIVVAMLPGGQISNHYPLEDWDLFKITETEKAKFPFDGHSSQDVIKRLKKIL
jgi:hypothetical protein